MTDQVQSLLKKNIPAGMLNSTLKAKMRDHCMQQIVTLPEPKLKILYVTPEGFAKSDRMRDVLKLVHRRNRLARIVIDEAHCVSAWGHDFREYASASRTYQTADVLHQDLTIKNCNCLKRSFLACR